MLQESSFAAPQRCPLCLRAQSALFCKGCVFFGELCRRRQLHPAQHTSQRFGAGSTGGGGVELSQYNGCGGAPGDDLGAGSGAGTYAELARRFQSTQTRCAELEAALVGLQTGVLRELAGAQARLALRSDATQVARTAAHRMRRELKPALQELDALRKEVVPSRRRAIEHQRDKVAALRQHMVALEARTARKRQELAARASKLAQCRRALCQELTSVHFFPIRQLGRSEAGEEEDVDDDTDAEWSLRRRRRTETAPGRLDAPPPWLKQAWLDARELEQGCNWLALEVSPAPPLQSMHQSALGIDSSDSSGASQSGGSTPEVLSPSAAALVPSVSSTRARLSIRGARLPACHELRFLRTDDDATEALLAATQLTRVLAAVLQLWIPFRLSARDAFAGPRPLARDTLLLLHRRLEVCVLGMCAAAQLPVPDAGWRGDPLGCLHALLALGELGEARIGGYRRLRLDLTTTEVMGEFAAQLADPTTELSTDAGEWVEVPPDLPLPSGVPGAQVFESAIAPGPGGGGGSILSSIASMWRTAYQ